LKWLLSVLVWQGSWVLVLVVGGCLWSGLSVRVVRGGSGSQGLVWFLLSVMSDSAI